MKTITKVAIGLIALASSNAFAATMQCYVDTPAWDEYTDNGCFAVGSASTTSANFKLINLNGGEINKVLWTGQGASACSTSSTQCSVPIRNRGRSIRLSADILYKDGTYETASATAVYEGYF